MTRLLFSGFSEQSHCLIYRDTGLIVEFSKRGVDKFHIFHTISTPFVAERLTVIIS